MSNPFSETEFIVQSDAIEGITADPELVHTQLVSNHTQGHVGAILFLNKLAKRYGRYLTEKDICRVQGLITAEQHTKPGGPRLKDEWIGAYRKINIWVGGRAGTDPAKVPAEMAKLVARIVEWQKKERATKVKDYDSVVKQISDFHFDYEHIHPFADGNGRSGRALVYYLFHFARIQPFIFTAGDRFDTYYNCFEDPMKMYEYFKNRLQPVDWGW